MENFLALEITNLSKQFKTKQNTIHALKNINLNVNKGEIFGLLGPNGAGKSTFINILAGTVIKSSGSVKVWNFDLDKNSGARLLLKTRHQNTCENCRCRVVFYAIDECGVGSLFGPCRPGFVHRLRCFIECGVALGRIDSQRQLQAFARLACVWRQGSFSQLVTDCFSSLGKYFL